MDEQSVKLDLLDKILSRNLTWVANADSKGTLLFGIDSAMLAVLVALVPGSDAWTTSAAIVATLTALPLAASVGFIAFGLFPRIDGPRNSLVYFGGIASHDENQYVRKVIDGITPELLEDFARQCHRNAEIAKAKYGHVRSAVILTFLALPFWLVAIWLMYPLKMV